ncbi:hypothetical protein DRE_07275 [Drechslerella stenobrocha 248]|uniref:Uncharacterized protein n=1 Tax=Drechslerella stenobrocha 248 TaxID=1043628 RepID=W7HIT6_9PEZI|nr:hypothetical protein DRE_07275 [Drechslerella stenobrocha 248]
MSSLLLRHCRPRPATINRITPPLTAIRTKIKTKLDPRHLCPGQYLHPDVIPLVRNLVAPFNSPTLPASDIWTILFTATRPRDPVSTTNLKAFAEHCEDLLARDAAVVCFVPGEDTPIKWWLSDIARSMDNPDLGLELDAPDDAPVSSRILGFPVISDKHYTIHERLGFIGPRDPPPPWEYSQPKRTPEHNLLHIVGPDAIVRFTQILPSSIGFNVLDVIRMLHAIQAAEDYDILIPADWTPGRDALMPYDRKRSKKGIAALKEVQSMAAPIPLPVKQLDEDGDDGTVIRDRDEDGDIDINETNIDEVLAEQRRMLEAEQAGEMQDPEERMPPGEVWEVLPYLKYVRIDDRVENTASVIGYENMRTDLLRTFERFKTEKQEKNHAKTEAMRRRQREKDARNLGALRNMMKAKGW